MKHKRVNLSLEIPADTTEEQLRNVLREALENYGKESSALANIVRDTNPKPEAVGAALALDRCAELSYRLARAVPLSRIEMTE